MLEGFVEAFGVPVSDYPRRSPVRSREKDALELKGRYSVRPSGENGSYCFVNVLDDA